MQFPKEKENNKRGIDRIEHRDRKLNIRQRNII